MRQAGIIAAAGIVALKQMVERLAEDHANALRLANGLSDVKGISIEPAKVSTNIVYMDLLAALSPDETVQRLENEGVKVLAAGPRRLRAVTHYQISAEDVEKAVAVFHKIM